MCNIIGPGNDKDTLSEFFFFGLLLASTGCLKKFARIGTHKTSFLDKGPVKLIKRVKIANSFLQSVSDKFHVTILSLSM